MILYMPNERKMSVLIIQPWLNYRGAETLSIHLAEDLVRKGYTAKFFCLFITDSVKNTIPIDLVLLPNSFWQRYLQNRFVFIVFGFWVMLYHVYFFGEKYDYYNPHNFPSVWVAAMCGRLRRKKVVWTVHNFPQHPFRGAVGKVYETLLNPLDRILVRMCTTIVSVSRKVGNEVFQKYGRESEIIYPGIDLDFFKINTGEKKGFGEGKMILHVAQIREEKMQQFSLDLFARIVEDFPDIQLVFVGEGDTKKLSFDRVKLGERVHFIGKVPKSELRFWYRSAYVLIYPSAWGEGCTLVPMEAMAAGVKNVLVVKGCGVDELLSSDENVFNNLEEAVEKLRLLLNSDSANDYSQLIKSYSRETFSEAYARLLTSV
jgi:glycosyltransferase involved in cell wall biosynthesis